MHELRQRENRRHRWHAAVVGHRLSKPHRAGAGDVQLTLEPADSPSRIVAVGDRAGGQAEQHRVGRIVGDCDAAAADQAGLLGAVRDRVVGDPQPQLPGAGGNIDRERGCHGDRVLDGKAARAHLIDGRIRTGEEQRNGGKAIARAGNLRAGHRAVEVEQY